MMNLQKDIWSGFQNGGGNQAAPQKLPVEWSPKKNIAWRVELTGYGQSSPVVWKDKIYVTTILGPNKEKNVVTAYHAKTGKQLWQKQLVSSFPQAAHDLISRAAATPSVDAGGVYAFFESGDFYALSHTGALRWHRDLGKEYGKPKNIYGLGSSPAQNTDSLFLLIEDEAPSYLLRIEKKSGKTLWKSDREPRTSYSSPILTRFQNQELLLLSSTGVVQAYETATGKRLWSLEGLSGNKIPTPGIGGELIFTGAAAAERGGGASVFSPTESNCCLKLVEKEGKPSYELLWKSKKASCGMMGPQFYKGLVYYVNATGVLFCLDSKTGEEFYSERIGDQCWAQAVGIDDRLYLFGKKGTTTVVKAGPKFEKVAVNALWESDSPPMPRVPTNAPPAGADGAPRGLPGGPNDPTLCAVAVAHDSFYLRVATHLYCVR